MSRSRRKMPFIGVTTANSEKQDKRLAHRRWRHVVKQILACNPHAVLPLLREVSDIWCWAKDGRQRIDEESKWMRK